MHQTVRQLLNVPDPGSITHTRLTYRPNGEKEDKMKRFMVYANGVLVDNIVVADNYTAEDYRDDCRLNGWETAPCTEDSEIELVESEEE